MTMTQEQTQMPQPMVQSPVETAMAQRHMGQAAIATQLDQQGIIRPQTMMELIEFCKLVAFSGMVPKNYEGKPGAVMVAVQMGAEVGLSPMAAIQNIAVINGRPTLWGDAVLAVIKRHPEFEGIEETSGDGWAQCTIKRKGNKPVTSVFTEDDARRAGLLSKDGPWQTYRPRMMKMRARSFAARDQFPDALRGIRVAEEELDTPPDNPLEAFVSGSQVATSAQPVAIAAKSQAKPTDESVKVINAFESIGVSRKMLVDKIGRQPEDLSATEIDELRRIYAEVSKSPKRKAELFGQPPSAADAINQQFGAQSDKAPAAQPTQQPAPQHQPQPEPPHPAAASAGF
jgi:hypothetical protein